jgi:TerC family integral membrane protein
MNFLMSDAMGTPVWLWAGFMALIIFLMVLDLGVFYRKSHVIGMRESLKLYAFYASLGILFAVFIWYYRNSQDAFLYLTGFVIEQSLSMDNVFVMAIIMNYFAIPREYQHRVLFWGILGVIVMRGAAVFAGAALITQFEWILYFFAVFLVGTGIKMLVDGDSEYDVSGNPALKLMRRYFRITHGLRGDAFVVREADKTGSIVWHITPLLVALVVIDVADIIFAVDSIPAIFSITQDPFIVFTSNIFAVLGLRALFFALSALLDKFHYMKYALALVLVFIGAKIFIEKFFEMGHLSAGWSLAITLAILAAGIIVSIYRPLPQPHAALGDGHPGDHESRSSAAKLLLDQRAGLGHVDLAAVVLLEPTHHLAHVLDRGCAGFGYALGDHLARLPLRQLRGQELADDLDLAKFLGFELWPCAFLVEPGALLALLDHLLQQVGDFRIVRPLLALAAIGDIAILYRSVDQPQRRNAQLVLLLLGLGQCLGYLFAHRILLQKRQHRRGQCGAQSPHSSSSHCNSAVFWRRLRVDGYRRFN